MPPETPSPHRFLPGRRQPSPSKGSKKPSAVRSSRGDGFGEPAPKPAAKPSRPVAKPAELSRGDGFAQSTPRPKSSSKQFAQTPRFSFVHSAVSPQAPRSASSSRPSLAHALRASVTTESVEDTVASPTDHPSNNDEDDEMLDFEQDAVPTTETFTQDLPHSPKRRRLGDLSISFQAALESPARPAAMFKHPTTPASALRNRPAQQFTRASGVASSVTDDGTAAVRRPAFLTSSVGPAENLEPLPEAFSPHRRGEKFVPGGMAATLQQWVVEAGQSAAHSRRGQGYLQGEAYVYRVEVESISGHGPMLMQCKKEDGDQLQVLLVSNGRQASSGIGLGSIVGVRAPSWEVEVKGHSWIVAVDWRMLS